MKASTSTPWSTRSMARLLLVVVVMVVVSSKNGSANDEFFMEDREWESRRSQGLRMEDLSMDLRRDMYGDIDTPMSHDATTLAEKTREESQAGLEKEKGRVENGYREASGKANEDSGTGDKECPPGTVKKASSHDSPSNGCGPEIEGMLTSATIALSGVRVFFDLFHDVCNTHDNCYGVCNVANDPDVQERCDRRLLIEAKQACSAGPLPPGKSESDCLSAVEMMHTGLQWGGKTHFSSAQRMACECDVNP